MIVSDVGIDWGVESLMPKGVEHGKLNGLQEISEESCRISDAERR